MPDTQSVKATTEVTGSVTSAPTSAAVRPHDIEAIPNSGGGTTHYCRTCGAMGVGLAPTLPCPGPPEATDA